MGAPTPTSAGRWKLRGREGEGGGVEGREGARGMYCHVGLTLRSELSRTRKAAQPRASVGGGCVGIDTASEALTAVVTEAGMSFEGSAWGRMAA